MTLRGDAGLLMMMLVSGFVSAFDKDGKTYRVAQAGYEGVTGRCGDEQIYFDATDFCSEVARKSIVLMVPFH
jgi:hypothetical protein